MKFNETHLYHFLYQFQSKLSCDKKHPRNSIESPAIIEFNRLTTSVSVKAKEDC